jgi:PAS domain-containing protein
MVVPVDAVADSRGRDALLGVALSEEATDYASIMLNDLGLVTVWTGGAESIFEFTASEMLGKGIWILLPTLDLSRAAMEAEMLRATESGRFETSRLHTSKRGRTFLGRTVWRKIDGGYVLIVKDLTTHLAKHSVLGALLEHLAEGVIIVDRNWRYVAFNSAAKRASGLMDLDVGRTVLDVFPNAKSYELYPHMEDAIEKGIPCTARGLSPKIGRDIVATYVPLHDGGVCIIVNFAPDETP